MVARAGVAVLAVLLLGWLAVQERDTRLHASGVAALQGGAQRATLARAEDDLRRARLLPAVAIYVGTCVLAVWVFRREAPRIAEEL